RYVFRCFAVDLFEQLDEFYLALASSQKGCDLAGTSVKGGEQLQGALALVLVLQLHGNESRLGGSCRRRTRTWLQGRLLVQRENPFVGLERTGVKIEDFQRGASECLVAWLLRAQPEVHTPRFELV